MELSTDRRFHSLTREQVHTLDQVLTEIIPIHGRGNFPTLEVKPKDIIHVVRDRLVEREIKVRDVRLNGSTASHVLVKENGTGYKDLDVIFGVELPKQEDFQIIKEVVLDCLRDFLPPGVNRDKITALTMKEAYVQKMVKVFTEHDRWSLISLSNNRGKNVELKFVNSLRRQFEFSVDSFQIILDRMLESYLVAESRQAGERKTMDEAAASFPENGKPGPVEGLPSTHHQNLNDPQSHSSELSSEACHDKEVLMREETSPCVSTLAEAVSMGDENVVKMKHRRHGEAELFAKAEPAATREGEAEVTGNVSPVTERRLAVSSSFGTQLRRVESFESIKLLSLETPAPSAYSLGPESTEALNQSMFVIKVSEFKEPELVRGSCESVVQCSTLPVHIEHPLPSPAKKTCKKSQMVVLKRSSPKPSRKMLKKVSSTAEETPIMSQVHLLSNQLLEPKVISSAQPSPPMLNEEPPFSTNCSQLSTKNTQDKECPVHLLGVPVSVHAVSSQNKATEVTELHTEQMCFESGESETLGKWALSQTTGSETSCGDQNSVHRTGTGTECGDQNPAHRTGTGTECGDQDPAQRTETETRCADQDTAHRTETGTECGDQDPAQRTETETRCADQDTAHRTETGTECGDQDLAHRTETGTECGDQDPAQRTERGTEYVGQDPACKPEPGTGCGDREPVQTTETGTGCSDQDPACRTEPGTGCDDQEPSHSTEPETGCGSQGPETVAQRPIAVSGHQESQSGLKMEKSEVLAPELPLITVVAESMYGDFEEAMDHLRRRLIATRNPEEIRGGGLLKYSNLLVREFTPADDAEIKSLERYMCSRFFIDFPDVSEQQRKIESYLRNHFIGEETSKYDYLMTLRRVIDESTVCLMGHERRQTLNMITILALKVLGEQNAIPNTSNVTCFYQPAPYVTDCNFNNYYIAHGQPPLIYHPYPLHIHMQTGLV